MVKWIKLDKQTFKRGKNELLFADEDDKGSYVVKYEDENGFSILFKSNSWSKTLKYLLKEAKNEGLIKEDKSIFV